MEFKQAYILLGNNIDKYKGKNLEYKYTSEIYEITNIYIGLKNPTAEDKKIIQENEIDFLGGIDTKVYSILKNKPCKVFIQLKNQESDHLKNITLEEMEKEFKLIDN